MNPSKLILIVDDELSIRRVLGRRGYSIIGKPYDSLHLHKLIWEALNEPPEETPL